MKTYSEQELKTIIDKHGMWLRSESGGERANLFGANLNRANLRGANLSEANLSEADLRGAYLSEADLIGADLNRADLSGANLIGANLNRAILSGANLNRANLFGADLSRANLRGANLLTFQFQQHVAYYTLDGTLRIGCEVMDIYSWSLYFEDIGEQNGYSKIQTKAYGNFIKSCLEMFKEGVI